MGPDDRWDSGVLQLGRRCNQNCSSSQNGYVRGPCQGRPGLLIMEVGCLSRPLGTSGDRKIPDPLQRIRLGKWCRKHQKSALQITSKTISIGTCIVLTPEGPKQGSPEQSEQSPDRPQFDENEILKRNRSDRCFLRTRTEIVDFRPKSAPPPVRARPGVPGTVPTNRHNTISNSL